MVELQHGTLLEERRGGNAILSTLVNEMVANSVDGYIRSERTPKDEVPCVGQLIIQNREVVAAIYESKRTYFSSKAIEKIESDCQELDCLIQITTNIDIPRIIEIYPESKVTAQTNGEADSQKWWQDAGKRDIGWTRSRKIPSSTQNLDDAEFIKIKASISKDKYIDTSEILRPGSVFSSNSEEIYSLAANLHELERPVLVISRRTGDDLQNNYAMPKEICLWLSSVEKENCISPEVSVLQSTIHKFLEENIRSVVLIDGLDYLSTLHSSEKVLEMIRGLCDRMRYEDDCLLIHVDEKKWTKAEFVQISRAAPHIENDTLSGWNNNSHLLADHPLLAPLNDEEKAQMERYIASITPVSDNENTEQKEVLIEETVEIIEEIEEQIEEFVEETPEPEIVPEIPKGPRKPQIVKRRKAKHIAPLNQLKSKKSALAAGKNKEITATLPNTSNIPKTAVGEGRTGSLPDIPNIIPNSLNQVTKQELANRDLDLPEIIKPRETIKLASREDAMKKPLSPVAARGVEVTKNLANRSQASSRPQKKMDLEKRLKSWKDEVKE